MHSEKTLIQKIIQERVKFYTNYELNSNTRKLKDAISYGHALPDNVSVETLCEDEELLRAYTKKLRSGELNETLRYRVITAIGITAAKDRDWDD